MRRAAALLLVLGGLLPITAAAQFDLLADDELLTAIPPPVRAAGVAATTAPTPAPPMVGACGWLARPWTGGELDESLTELEHDPAHPGTVTRTTPLGANDQRALLGHDFRGLGSPGHALEFRFPTHALFGVDGRFGAAVSMAAIDAVLLNLSGAEAGRMCLTVGGDVMHGAASGPDWAITAGTLAPRFGWLFRTRSDSIRLRLEAQVVLSIAGLAVDDEHRLERQGAGIAGSLAVGPTDEILTLAPLEWGARGIGQFTYRWSDAPHWGVWLDARVALGYARLATSFGPRDGMVGGVELLLLGGGRGFVVHQEPWSMRLGPRLAMGFGSLWPSDVVLPFEVGGRIDFAVSENGDREWTSFVRHALTLDLTGVYARFPVLGDAFAEQTYFRAAVSYSVATQ